MGKSVIVDANRRQSTVEEVAASYGIRGRRLKTLLVLVKEELARPAPKFKNESLIGPITKAAKKRAKPSK